MGMFTWAPGGITAPRQLQKTAIRSALSRYRKPGSAGPSASCRGTKTAPTEEEAGAWMEKGWE